MFRSNCGGWIAGDATYSIALPDGRTLWLFGDSFIGTALPDSSIAPGADMIRNCGVIQTGDSLHALYGGTFDNPTDFIPPPQPDSSWFWPENGLVENDTLKIFMSEFITNNGPPGWNFEFHNTYLVFLSFPDLSLLGMEVLPYHAQNSVMYGNQVMADGGFNYIYGRRDGPNNTANAHVARVPQGSIQAPWEFYTGAGWSSDPATSAWITFQAVSQQYAVFRHEQKYVMLTQDIWLGTKIFTLTANTPVGPWGNKTEIYNTPLPFPTQLTYNAWAHPQFDEENQLLVSYNSNGDFWSIFSNVELYRPTFIRVPFEMIDSTFLPTNINSLMPESDDDVVLFQNFPNPVSQMTTFALDLRKRQYISLELFNTFGIKVTSFVNKELPPGHYEFSEDLSDLDAGIYFYRLDNLVKKLLKNE
ncbi:MAG: hypothetical protein IH596_11285 [Bacteroidales bacterium]|nr:hypothetical protein [Bacteroidales bacterium]